MGEVEHVNPWDLALAIVIVLYAILFGASIMSYLNFRKK